jgi:3-hydroxybutyryl-CoA dehydrogenase
MPADTPAEIWSDGGRTQIGVVGAGVMGAEIALIAAQSGFRVTILDIDAPAVDRGLAHAQAVGRRQVAKGRITADDLTAALARIVPATDDDDLAGCAIVIEAVTESMDVKQALFERLDHALPEKALIASNTSGLSITALGAATGRPERVLGLHFFNPPTVMRLVEVVRGRGTSPETADAGIALARAMGKTPVVVAECPGFLVNRVLVRAMVAAYRYATARGTDPGAVDAAVVEAGPAPMGPFALGDLIGLDTLASIAADLRSAYGERFWDGGALAPHVAAGRLGRKSGGGFLAAGSTPGAVDDSAREAARAYYSEAVDEARRCLVEGVAESGDIDVALRLGAGWSEGPLAWAGER